MSWTNDELSEFLQYFNALREREKAVAALAGEDDAMEEPMEAAQTISNLKAKLQACEKQRDEADALTAKLFKGHPSMELVLDLTTRLADVEKQRDEAIKEREEMRKELRICRLNRFF